MIFFWQRPVITFDLARGVLRGIIHTDLVERVCSLRGFPSNCRPDKLMRYNSILLSTDMLSASSNLSTGDRLCAPAGMEGIEGVDGSNDWEMMGC